MNTKAPTWSRAFDDPITLPDGRAFRTLHDAGHFVATLLKAVQERIEWQIRGRNADPCGERAPAGCNEKGRPAKCRTA
jgi:hypothetical protein